MIKSEVNKISNLLSPIGETSGEHSGEKYGFLTTFFSTQPLPCIIDSPLCGDQ